MAKRIVYTNMRATDPVANWDGYMKAQQALEELCQDCQVSEPTTWSKCYYCGDGLPVCRDCKTSGNLLFCEDCE